MATRLPRPRELVLDAHGRAWAELTGIPVILIGDSSETRRLVARPVSIPGASTWHTT